MATLRYMLLILLLPTLLLGGEATFTGTTHVRDTYIVENSSANYGSADTVRLQSQLFQTRNGLFRVTNLLDSIPFDAIITSCTLSGYVEFVDSGLFSPTVSYTKLCKDWSEGAADWIEATTPLDWGSAGASQAGGAACDSCENASDTSPDILSTSVTFNPIDAVGWYKFPIPTCDAQAWVDGSDGDNGIRMKVLGNGDIVTFTSSEDATNPPEFKFTWTVPSDTAGINNDRHSIGRSSIRHSLDGSSVRHKIW